MAEPKKPAETTKLDVTTPLRLPEHVPLETPLHTPINQRVSSGHLAAKKR